jgi:hypothetical protein
MMLAGAVVPARRTLAKRRSPTPAGIHSMRSIARSMHTLTALQTRASAALSLTI